MFENLWMRVFVMAVNLFLCYGIVVGNYLFSFRDFQYLMIIYCTFAAEYVDMVKAGIIDPVKVIRTALVDAARYFFPIEFFLSAHHKIKFLSNYFLSFLNVSLDYPGYSSCKQAS